MPFRFSSIIFTLRNAVPWHLSALPYGQSSKHRPWCAFEGSSKNENNPSSNLSRAAGALLPGFCTPELNHTSFILTWKLCSSWEVQGSRISPVRDPRRQEAVSWLLPQTRSTKSRQTFQLPTIKTVPHSSFPWGIKGDLWSVMKNKKEGIVMLLNLLSCFFIVTPALWGIRQQWLRCGCC